jgi:hypothetical protein
VLSKLITTTSLAFVLLMSGCATPTKMAFLEDSDQVSKTKPTFLMTATLRNSYRTSFQPKLIVVHVERAVVKGAEDRINFTMDKKAKNESDSAIEGSSYLLRMELESGEYVIRGLSSMGRTFPIIGAYFAPVHAKLTSAEPGVFYLGHIEATVRERKDNEFKAGPSIPLIDQAIAGASTGTFDMEISDQWEKDGPRFLAKFQVLNGVNVQKRILAPFDRAVAQKWWEEN